MRNLAIALAAALILPVMALAAMVAQQEYRLADAKSVTVPLTGYDPRDLLLGHYIVAQLDWDWESEPGLKPYRPVGGGLCVLSVDPPKPRVRFLPDWKTGDSSDRQCRLVLAGHAVLRGTGPARFVPTALDDGAGRLKLYVAEERGSELEEILRKRPGALTVELAVRADGSAAVKALRLDGRTFAR